MIPDPDPDGGRTADSEVVDAFIAASRALVALAVRSLVHLEDEVTLPQYRVLVLLAMHGTQRSGDLAANLGVAAPTASRMVERLAGKGLIRRSRVRADRRAVQLYLTEAGRKVVEEVTDRRKTEIRAILREIPESQRKVLTNALRTFAAAAGEAPERDWALGWET